VGARGQSPGGAGLSSFVDALQWLVGGPQWSGPDGIPSRVSEHLQMSIISLLLAALIAIPVGLWVGHTRKGRFLTTQAANLGRAVPSFAVLSIMFLIVIKISPKLAFGFLPTVVALTLLGIPVILINTYVGIEQVDADTVEAARGMGMSGRQVLFRLEVPMATPLIMTGLRLAAVQIVATAGLAALIAGGGLGRYIIDGFANQDTPKLVGGAILVAALAIATDGAFYLLGRAVAPKLSSRGARGSAPVAFDPAEPARIP
jgi:osmoprotectant transport system permease protein